MTSDIKDTLEETFWKLALLKQAVRGIAHRGASGDFEVSDVDDEMLPVEGVIDGVQAGIEKALEAVVKEAAA